MENKKIDPFEILGFVALASQKTLATAFNENTPKEVISGLISRFYFDILIVIQCMLKEETRNELMFTLNLAENFNIDNVIEYCKTITGLDEMEV